MKTIKPWTAYILIIGGFAGGVATVVGLNGGLKPSVAIAQRTPFAKTVGNEVGTNVETLRGLNTSLADLADYVKPAVVHIRATNQRLVDGEGKRIPLSGSEGSGFIYRADGYIITNDHVVSGSKNVTVILNNGKEYSGKVMSAPEFDVAVIKIEGQSLPTLGIGNSKSVRPGEMVMAIGSPFGLENSVTFGHVSALGRENAIPDMDGGLGASTSTRFYPDLIQTDAAINVGNSGGPLVNIEGQVIGMNSSIYSRSGGSNGIAFAIPSNQVRFLADMLIKNGKVVRAAIGLVPRDLKPFEKEEKKIGAGAYVVQVQPGSPADKAGLKEGDVITNIQGKTITSQMDLRNSMLENAPGSTVNVEYWRNGKAEKTKAKIEAAKEIAQQAPRARLKDNLDDLFGQGAPNMDELRKKLELQFRGKDKAEEKEVEPLGDERPKARLGVSIANIDDEERKTHKLPKSVTGVVVTSVEPNSVAEKFGLLPGDVVESIGNKAVGTVSSLTEAVSNYKKGETVKIKISRYSSENTSISVEKSIKF
jgi:serine protease Do